MIRSITKRQFDAYCYCRKPLIRFITTELAWYISDSKNVIGTVVMDLTDNDYNYLVLGRDKSKVMRAIDLGNEFFDTIEDATDSLLKKMDKYEQANEEIFEQGDEKALPNEILQPVVKDEKLHPYFKFLVRERRYEAARAIIKEIAYSYVDVDGNYIKDFQTTGFDARLWELYLYVFLHTHGYEIDRSFNAPDYVASLLGEEFAIEAVSVNANKNFDEPSPSNAEEALDLTKDYMPIKFGSSLYSKLQKKYWEKPYVAGKPLIIAIHDFHMPATVDNLGSMTWSRAALCDYLYGVRLRRSLNEDGKTVINVRQTSDGIEPIMEKISHHTWKGKTIPSNFFELPDSENISAVLFSNNATLTAFNRMGKLAGLGGADIKMLRNCVVYDTDPQAYMPKLELRDVDDENYEEAWGDSLVMYHNPNAKYPVRMELFPMISHVFYNKKTTSIQTFHQENEVIQSWTIVMVPQKQD